MVWLRVFWFTLLVATCCVGVEFIAVVILLTLCLFPCYIVVPRADGCLRLIAHVGLLVVWLLLVLLVNLVCGFNSGFKLGLYW